MTDIDFDSINRELEESATKRDLKDFVPIPFDNFFQSMQEQIFLDCMEKAYEDKNIDYYFDLGCKGPKKFLRRLIRRMNKFLFFRNFEMQSNFNSSVLQMNQILHKGLQTMKEEHEKDLKTIQILEERVHKLEERL